MGQTPTFKSQSYEIIRRNESEMLRDVAISKDLFDMTLSNKSKIDKQDYIKLKSFCK